MVYCVQLQTGIIERHHLDTNWDNSPYQTDGKPEICYRAFRAGVELLAERILWCADVYLCACMRMDCFMCMYVCVYICWTDKSKVGLDYHARFLYSELWKRTQASNATGSIRDSILNW